MRSLKPLIATLLLISAAFFCLFTNPTEEEYLKWAQTQYQSQQTTSKKGLAEVFLQVAGPSLIKKSTSSTNYLIFTLFETKFDGSCMQTIGILDHFIPLPVVSTGSSS
nr:hypothetical protein [uncultured Cellulosilyticum sp.]